MPITKSAKKKLRQDKKKKSVNASRKTNYKKSIKTLKKNQDKSKAAVNAYSSIDKAVKRGVLHKRKAARLKSQVARLAKRK